MKKIILLVITSLVMVGCNIEHQPRYQTVYAGDNWDVFSINDSIYLMIPNYKEYHIPYILNIKDKATIDSVRNAGNKNVKSLLNN